MNSRGNALKLTAVSALVVLTLTGFSTGRGGSSSGGGDGSGGGGCSSSSQNHDSSGSGGSHSDYDDDYDDTYDDTGSGGADVDASPAEQDATVELVDCASPTAPYATVEVTNPNAASGSFTVTVTFRDASGAEVTAPAKDVHVPGNDTVTARVEIDDSAAAGRVDDCDPDPYAPPAV